MNDEAKKAVEELFDVCSNAGGLAVTLSYILDAVHCRAQELDNGEAKLASRHDPMFTATLYWIVERFGLETVSREVETYPIPEIEETVGSA